MDDGQCPSDSLIVIIPPSIFQYNLLFLSIQVAKTQKCYVC